MTCLVLSQAEDPAEAAVAGEGAEVAEEAGATTRAAAGLRGRDSISQKAFMIRMPMILSTSPHSLQACDAQDKAAMKPTVPSTA